ncbi:MAG: hypothetical protein ABR511_12180 [Acidimicrobiales bacterium]
MSNGLAMAVLVPVLLASCGGKEKPGAAKQKYIVQSDAICRDFLGQVSSAGSTQDQPTAQKLADVYQGWSDRLRGLQMPTESIEQARQFVTQVENIGLGYSAAFQALAVNDQARATKSFGEVATVKKQAAATAKEYGYTDCQRIGG